MNLWAVTIVSAIETNQKKRREMEKYSGLQMSLRDGKRYGTGSVSDLSIDQHLVQARRA